MTAAVAPPVNSLHSLWLTETLRLREEHAGPLEDLEANRRARAEGGELSARIQHRALWLSQRDGLLEAWQHWRQGSRLALLALLIAALFSGAGLAFAALGNDRAPVNVFWALGSLMGLNTVMLLGWLGGLLFAGDNTASLGRLWFWLSEKLARDARAAQLVPALVLLLQRQRLNRWALGTLVNGLWSLVSLSALTVLLLLLATRRYEFVWETTLLDGDTFVALTHALGALPAVLGFLLPDDGLIRASGDVALPLDSARQAWAAWLVGVLLVYGLLPRLLLCAVCRWRWSRGRKALQLDPSLAGYGALREKLMPSSERLGINDPAPALSIPDTAGALHLGNEGALLVAIELDGEHTWPPTLPANVCNAGILDTREQRQHLLEQLSRHPAARLVIACDPRRSADRGSLALIAELARGASTTRVWLLPAPPGQALDNQRLGDWHSALGAMNLAFSDSAPWQWLEHGDD